ADLEAKLATRLPIETLQSNVEIWAAARAKQAVAWTLLKPKSARSEIPTLKIQSDGSVLASGDQSKRDVYEVNLEPGGLRQITAIRLEMLPDARLPKNGPGRVSYEGPFGDFWLSEVALAEAPRLLGGGWVLGAGPALKFASA